MLHSDTFFSILFLFFFFFFTQMLVVFMAWILWFTNAVTLYPGRRGLPGPTLRDSDFVDCGFLIALGSEPLHWRIRNCSLKNIVMQDTKKSWLVLADVYTKVIQVWKELEGERNHSQLVRSEQTSWKEGSWSLFGQALKREWSHRRARWTEDKGRFISSTY